MGDRLYFNVLRRNPDLSWLFFGLSITASYAFALLKIKSASVLFLVLSAICMTGVVAASDIRFLYVCASISIPIMLHSGGHITWDVASFELQGYYDWQNGVRGAYWDYSKLPAMLYGTAFTAGSIVRAGFYGLTIVTLAAAITRLIKERESPASLYIYTSLAFILSNILSGLWDYGKGDAITTSFLLLSLSFCYSFHRGKSEREGINLSLLLIFSCLSLASKLYSIIYISPLWAFVFAFHARRVLFLIKRPLIFMVSLYSIVTCAFTYAYNLSKYQQLLDPSAIALQSGKAIKDHIPEVLSAAFHMPVEMNAVTLVIILMASASHFSEREKSKLNLVVYVSLVLGIVFTPLTLLHGVGVSYNFRLIAFPLISMIAFYAKPI
jgi:hypothetical protein